MIYANPLELYMLELLNEERSSRNLDLFVLETNLNSSAEEHSQWMFDTNSFSHTGVDGTSPRERMEDAGFELSGSWGTAENIAIQSARGAEGYFDDVYDLHVALMNSAGHRANILNPDLAYIGIGIEIGSYTYSGSFTANSVNVTQNFARTAGAVDLDDLNGGQGNSTVDELPFFGSSAADTLSGTAEADEIWGNAGHDVLRGEAGGDTLEGGAGNDLVFGGSGHDVIEGMEGFDTIWGGTGNDTIWGGGWNDTLGGAQGNDSILGDNGSDLIWGGDGNDTINGGAHADTLRGGSNNDLIRGGGGNDDVQGGWGWDNLDGGDGNDTVDGFMGNDFVHGGAGNDILLGGVGDDMLDGGDGDDMLFAGWGNDTVTGGNGADMFVFGFDPGSDVFTDFNAAEGDVLRVDDVLWRDTHGTLTSSEVVSTFGTVSGGTLTLSFDSGEVLVLNGVSDLASSMEIF